MSAERYSEVRGDWSILVWFYCRENGVDLWAYTANCLSARDSGIVKADNRHEAVDEAYEEIKRKV